VGLWFNKSECCTMIGGRSVAHRAGALIETYIDGYRRKGPKGLIHGNWGLDRGQRETSSQGHEIEWVGEGSILAMFWP